MSVPAISLPLLLECTRRWGLVFKSLFSHSRSPFLHQHPIYDAKLPLPSSPFLLIPSPPSLILPQPLPPPHLRMKRSPHLTSLLRIKPPNPRRLLALDPRPSRSPTDHLHQPRKDRILRCVSRNRLEKRPLPIPALLPFLFPQLALGVLDLGLVRRHGIHVAFLDRGGDLAPRAPGLKRVLFLDRPDR